MFRHIVLIKTAAPAEVRAILDTLPGLRGRVPGLVAVDVFGNASQYHRGFEQCFVMDFTDAGALAAWDDHPAHPPIRDALLRLSELVVVDHPVPGAA
ncbi:Dabb family protein [Dactylosporangium sp. NPDC051541]|uniref:Dabb family protein n=1 Tax=Dactylosporangium sp. NPDC051541 TaxID=3363977 RepID=UPI0037A6B798